MTSEAPVPTMLVASNVKKIKSRTGEVEERYFVSALPDGSYELHRQTYYSKTGKVGVPVVSYVTIVDGIPRLKSNGRIPLADTLKDFAFSDIDAFDQAATDAARKAEKFDSFFARPTEEKA